ncbi:MAG: hypothetical protein ABIQ44_04760 [Chloroflexia bacterium]
MTQRTLPESILYPMESREELAELAALLEEQYQPKTESEYEIFDRILVASWMRKRYEKVRGKLYDRKHALEATSPQMPITIDSIKRFQQEVDQQKKQVAGLRKSLRKLREGESAGVQEDLYEYLPAA